MRNEDALFISWIMIISMIAGILILLYYPPSDFALPNIFQAPIEAIPLDSGWVGFVFVFVNGFLLSFVLAGEEVDIIERLLLSIGLGFGVTFLVMILIGILWEISFLTIILAQTSLFIILLFAAFHQGLKLNYGYLKTKKKNFSIPKFTLVEKILLIVIGIYAVVAIYQTVAYPAIEWDSLAYGVNYAKIIFKNGKIPLIAGASIGLEMSASYPPGVQLLAVYLYVFAGNANDFYFRVLQPIFGLATMMATYKFAIIVTKNRTASIFAMFILSALPIFWELFIHETYFTCLTLMLTLSAFFFFKAYNSDDDEAKKYEIVGILFCCFSALTSYIGMSSFGLFLLYSMNRRLSAKRFTWLTLSALFIILPWYGRNLLLLGNPVYPFFGIGNYLDPLLWNSTTQHFQNWLKVPFFNLLSIICKIGAGLLFLAVVYLNFARKKQFLLIFFSYLLLVGIVIMAVHIPFLRYLVIALPVLAIILSASTNLLLKTQNLVKRITPIILIMLLLISSAVMLPYINFFKPSPICGGDKWSYLSQVFEEADAWKWINENTPTDAKIATYDIKEYYIERGIFALDGNEAAPLYKIDTIEESVNFFEERNITYILSVPWAAPLDTRMPPAYKWCVFTRYLGDPCYLPPVYVGLNGSAVYHVGALEEETVYESFAKQNFIPPIKHVTVNLAITNTTSLPSGKFHMPIPVDYREGFMMASVNSSKHLVSVELWQGIIPEVVITPSGTYRPLKQWPIQSANGSGVENPSFVWQINKWGYFTFFVIDREEKFTEGFNVTVDIRFYNYWDIQPLFVSEGTASYNITAFNATFPLLKTLYIQANKSATLSINSKTADKKISLEIFKDFLPNNVLINWSQQYDMVAQQPKLGNVSGEVNPSIQNLFLPYGRYSILVVYRDSYTELVDISLEVEFTSWKGS